MEPSAVQLTILVLCSQGKTRHEIARELDYSPWTVKRRLDDLREILRAGNIPHALTICIARGYLAVDGRRGTVFIPKPIDVAPIAA